MSYVEYFLPTLLHPAPPMISIPDKCPGPIAQELGRAFALFWVDPSASANRIRCAVEALLTACGVVRGQLTTKRKLHRLNLHERIALFRERYPELADALLATKWIGNSGSHQSGLTKDDVLDGLEILEHVLDELYAGNRRRVAAIAKQINRRKRPRSTK